MQNAIERAEPKPTVELPPARIAPPVFDITVPLSEREMDDVWSSLKPEDKALTITDIFVRMMTQSKR